MTGRDVAQAAGVSLNTVSLVVRNSALVAPETRARVQQVIDLLGYRPHAAAAALASDRSHTLGYLVQRGPDVNRGELITNSDIFHNQVLNAVAARARSADHYLLVDTFTDVQRCLSLLSSGRIDGAVVDWYITDAMLGELMAHSAPIVLAGRDAGDLPVSWVKADEEGGAYQATRYLVDLGHRQLALLAAQATLDSAPAQARVRGYRRALEEAGLPHDPRYTACGDWTIGSGYLLGRELLAQRPRPTALFVLGEAMAMGVIQAAETLGLCVPEDVALVTTEDSLLVEYAQPRLSAVHVPMYDVGLRATEVLLALLDDPAATPLQVVLPTTVIVRDSSAPLHATPVDRGESPELETG